MVNGTLIAQLKRVFGNALSRCSALAPMQALYLKCGFETMQRCLRFGKGANREVIVNVCGFMGSANHQKKQLQAV